jgi:hypothetical protein
MNATIIFYTVQCHADDGLSQSLFASRDEMLAALRDGVFRNPLAIYESEVAGLCRDISEDTARELSDALAQDGAGLPSPIADFIERELGVAEAQRVRNAAGVSR